MKPRTSAAVLFAFLLSLAAILPAHGFGPVSGHGSVVVTQLRFNAGTSQLNVLTYLPNGYITSASASSAIGGALIADAGSLHQIWASYTGNVANVGGQTVTFQLYDKNLNPVPGASVTGGTGAGVFTISATFAPVAIHPGDVYYMAVTPNSALTATITFMSTVVS